MARPQDDGAYLSTGAAARRLGISRFTLLRAVRRGEIRPDFQTPGGYHRFATAAVMAYAARLVAAQDPGHPRDHRASSGRPSWASTSQERLRTLYATMACGVLVLTTDGTVCDVNGAA